MLMLRACLRSALKQFKRELSSGKKTSSSSSSSSSSSMLSKGGNKISKVARDRNFVPTFTTALYKDESATSSSAAASLVTSDSFKQLSLFEQIKAKRFAMYPNGVLNFPFNQKRVRLISNADSTKSTTIVIKTNSKSIVYWMSRDQRVQDNWSLLYAQKLALEKQLELHVCFCLLPNHMEAPIRHYHFMLEGLKEVEKELRELNIPFHLLIGQASERLPEFVQSRNAGALVCDFSPLRGAKKWLEDLRVAISANATNSSVPIIQVDAHNVVPCWIASDRLEISAPPFRAKMKAHLDEFLSEFPPVISHVVNKDILWTPINWENDAYAKLKCDMSVKQVSWATPGYRASLEQLDLFIKKRLKDYGEFRNEPNKHVVSDLSPWYHFGQLSRQRAALEVKKHGVNYSQSVNVYIEQTVVRRELSDNFCNYNPNYDNFDGAEEWAKRTLIEHMQDKRERIYTYDELDNCKTHDKLWNAAQIQMRVDGKMHTFFRMYWAKRIIEWTETPQQALEYAIKMNDRYELDGRDSPGFTGVMWSICGVHDQPFPDRKCFGKIRPMTYEGCKRKFDIDEFVTKWMNKKHLI